MAWLLPAHFSVYCRDNRARWQILIMAVMALGDEVSLLAVEVAEVAGAHCLLGGRRPAAWGKLAG